MSESERTRAEAQTDAALASSNFQDPRPAFRERLRYFREARPDVYQSALAYFEGTVVPLIAGQQLDPLAAWFVYGKRLAELTGAGQTFSIDASGRAWPDQNPTEAHQLILHVPDDTTEPVLPLAVPRDLSAAQEATVNLLVQRARGLV